MYEMVDGPPSPLFPQLGLLSPSLLAQEFQNIRNIQQVVTPVLQESIRYYRGSPWRASAMCRTQRYEAGSSFEEVLLTSYLKIYLKKTHFST